MFFIFHDDYIIQYRVYAVSVYSLHSVVVTFVDGTNNNPSDLVLDLQQLDTQHKTLPERIPLRMRGSFVRDVSQSRSFHVNVGSNKEPTYSLKPDSFFD